MSSEISPPPSSTGDGMGVEQAPAPSHPEPDAGTATPVVVAELPDTYFELYKLAVEMADRVSARRALANTFFLSVNTAVLALLGVADVQWYAGAAGIVICVVWWALLKSYRELNRAKFVVILAMEERLPARVFGDEWKLLRREPVRFALRPVALRPWVRQYRELGYIERIVPWVFAVIYLAAVVRQLAR